MMLSRELQDLEAGAGADGGGGGGGGSGVGGGAGGGAGGGEGGEGPVAVESVKSAMWLGCAAWAGNGLCTCTCTHHAHAHAQCIMHNAHTHVEHAHAHALYVHYTCAACAPQPLHCTGRVVHVRRRYAAWLDLVDDLGLVEIGLGVETGLGGVFKGQYKGQFTREKAPLCFELTY